jgi:hypothetical protein
MRPLTTLCFAFSLAVCGDSILLAQPRPQPGDLYREFARHNGGNKDWRVTDANAVIKFDRAQDHLPNSRLPLQIDDLQHAVRAEVLLDRWGGHRGTINKRIRFNDHAWITVPEIKDTPDGVRPEMLMFQDNPVVEIPLEHLVEGANIFDANCDEEGGFGWGQWGLYSLVLRVYYDRDAKGDNFQISGEIVSPRDGSQFGDQPQIEVAASAPNGVARIDVLASYDGYDEDGDGQFGGWHESHFQLVRGEANEIRDHVGTLWKQPYRLTWDTHWVPDQKSAAISLIARIQDSRGYWSVTEPVDQLSLWRNDVHVKLYRARDIPEDFAVRADETKQCFFDIPEADRISEATEAAVCLRTWHGWDGHHEPLKINDYQMPIEGKNHFYDYDLLPVPPSQLKDGENTFTIHSKTEHHMLEVLWPGPAIVARIPKPEVAIGTDIYQNREHFVVETLGATYWLDKNSGGLSRLIDPDGHDWIAYKSEPWNQYPASAAGAYRGLPNLLFGADESGFGHPGWDRAVSERTNDTTITSTSLSGKWKLRWEFSAYDVQLSVETSQPKTPYWFLYEGPIAGRFAPNDQYFAADTVAPTDEPRDYSKQERHVDKWRWVYFGDTSVARVMYIIHEQADDAIDTFSHLGDTKNGIDSDNGMVVFGFGRGPQGIEPLLTGNHSFRIGLREGLGNTSASYERLSRQFSSQLKRTSRDK